MSALALQIGYVSNECTVEVLGNKQVSCIVLSIATNMSGICLRLRHLLGILGEDVCRERPRQEHHNKPFEWGGGQPSFN